MICKNKSPKSSNELVKPPEKNCSQCNVELTKDNLIRNSSYTGYNNKCKTCRNKNNLKYSRKKSARIKANPLW